ncbi:MULTISPECIES: 3-phosphoshikimate 1-carboxyvinyltransferase [Allobacillus]|uniref:3-phosphoshikimate 1-carboxyvinyltransferase n=1 Tax=Allobacillus salarius TaxID=1955272 RepID=A0A556PTX9_9BACI|nr:3-phosphoshikimate 1-carboxyvinyltransferase [Allobacillus salarius]TSJ67857.1 3-phosphoshikimate 1-carboxyvinyltransferase [Allobacillus salarius]
MNGINGTLIVPGDKSISHRAAILASLSTGKTVIDNFLFSEDCLRTLDAFQEMGVQITKRNQQVIVESEGPSKFLPAKNAIDLGNSGTTARLLAGVLSAMPFSTVIKGDSSLSSRPMKRVTEPLSMMGAKFKFLQRDGHLPMTIEGGRLKQIDYEMPVASAQVKSAVLLAALTGQVHVSVTEQTKSRDHTERMLEAYGIHIEDKNGTITLRENQVLHAKNIEVPGDFSSAAYWIAAAVITPGSELTIEHVGLNPTRIGFLNVLKRMGASIEIIEKLDAMNEPVGTIIVRYSTLNATSLEIDEIPTLIDEIPILALVATQAEGTSHFHHLEELRFKETDRIKATVLGLEELGADIQMKDDGMVIQGRTRLHGGVVKTFHDHRIAMTAMIASLITSGDVTVDDQDCVKISYPNFFEQLNEFI